MGNTELKVYIFGIMNVLAPLINIKEEKMCISGE